MNTTSAFITTTAKTIALKNEDKVQRELDAVQARARTRFLSYSDLVRATQDAEKRLEAMAVPVKERAGAEVLVDPHRVPGSYRGAAEGTSAVLRRTQSGWSVVRIERTRCRQATYGFDAPLATKVTLSVSETRRATALERLQRKYGVEFTIPVEA